MTVNFYDVFSPCVILYPFSTTAASTSPNNVDRWLIYRLYMLLTYMTMMGMLIARVYITVSTTNMVWNIINKPSMLTAYCISFTLLIIQSMMPGRTNKVKKLMTEINEMEDCKISDRKYKIYNAIFSITLLINHVGCNIVNILNMEGAEMFLLPLTFICLTFDSEILVLTSFVSIFHSKMEPYILRLKEIIKQEKEEDKGRELYEKFRQMLHILKRINSIWQARILVIISFELYTTTRTILKLIAKSQVTSTIDAIFIFSFISKYTSILRHFLIFIQFGLLGQWIAQRFDQIAQLANTIHDLDLGEELNHETWKISRLAAVSPVRLVAGSVTVDGQLPLSAMSAVISAVIMALQFGLTVY